MFMLCKIKSTIVFRWHGFIYLMYIVTWLFGLCLSLLLHNIHSQYIDSIDKVLEIPTNDALLSSYLTISTNDTECKPNSKCNINGDTCVCSDYIKKSICNGDEYNQWFIEIHLDTIYSSSYENISLEITKNFSKSINIDIVNIFKEKYTPVCVELISISDGSIRYYFSLYLSKMIPYDKITTDDIITQLKNTNILANNSVQNVTIKTNSNSLNCKLYDDFKQTNPLLHPNSTECACVTQPNVHQTPYGCIKLFKFDQQIYLKGNHNITFQRLNFNDISISTILNHIKDKYIENSHASSGLAFLESIEFNYTKNDEISIDYYLSQMNDMIFKLLNETSNNILNNFTMNYINNVDTYKIIIHNITNIKDKNECLDGNVCSRNAFCVNTFGSYYCVCKPYFNGDGIICTQITTTYYKNECPMDNFYVTLFNRQFCISDNTSYYKVYFGLSITLIMLTLINCSVAFYLYMRLYM